MEFGVHGSGVSFDVTTGVLRFTRSGSWSYYAQLINMPYKFSDLNGHKIRVAFDYIASGVTSNYQGFVFVPNEYNGNTASNSRQAGIPQDVTGLRTGTTTSGHLEWSGVLTTDILTLNPNQHSENNYWGAFLGFHGPASASATISNIVYEYL